MPALLRRYGNAAGAAGVKYMEYVEATRPYPRKILFRWVVAILSSAAFLVYFYIAASQLNNADNYKEELAELLFLKGIFFLLLSLWLSYEIIPGAIRAFKEGRWPPTKKPLLIRTKVYRGKSAKLMLLYICLFLLFAYLQVFAAFYKGFLVAGI